MIYKYNPMLSSKLSLYTTKAVVGSRFRVERRFCVTDVPEA